MQTYIGQETQITIGGKTYTCSRLTRSIKRKYLEWHAGRRPDPLAQVAEVLDKFAGSPSVQDFLVKEAWAEKRRLLDFDSPEVQESVMTGEGGTKLLALLLHEHHPGLTEDDVHDLAHDFFRERLADKADEVRGAAPDATDEEVFQAAVQAVMGDTFRVDLQALRGAPAADGEGRGEGVLPAAGLATSRAGRLTTPRLARD